MRRILVVGGHTRNIGKTQLVAEIIRAFPQARWTAMKLTQFGHGVCSLNGKTCGCAVDEHTVAIQQERDTSGRSDTSRFLVAGAERVFWVRTKQGRLAEALPLLRRHLDAAENVILESNSVLRFLQPDLYLSVLDFSRRDFKASAREFLDRADAYVLLAPALAGLTPPGGSPAWDGVGLERLGRKPVFVVWPQQLCPLSLVNLIRERAFTAAIPSG